MSLSYTAPRHLQLHHTKGFFSCLLNEFTSIHYLHHRELRRKTFPFPADVPASSRYYKPEKKADSHKSAITWFPPRRSPEPQKNRQRWRNEGNEIVGQTGLNRLHDDRLLTPCSTLECKTLHWHTPCRTKDCQAEEEINKGVLVKEREKNIFLSLYIYLCPQCGQLVQTRSFLDITAKSKPMKSRIRNIVLHVSILGLI